MSTLPVRVAAAGGAGGRLLRLSNITTMVQGSGSGALDIPFLTRTGNILLFVVCGDVSGTVESPYTITYDIPGANQALTQHKAVGGGEGSGRPRLIIATVAGVPITNLSKNIRLATAASTLSQFNILVADLPGWWSGAVGNSDAAAVNSTKNNHGTAAISTGAKNSLLVGGGGCIDATLGALIVSGQGGPWKPATPQLQSGAVSTSYMARFASKNVAKNGATVDFALATASGGNSANWSAGVVELRP